MKLTNQSTKTETTNNKYQSQDCKRATFISLSSDQCS